MAREAREAAVRRKKRMRTARNVGIIAVLFVGTIVIFNIVSGGSSKKSSSTTTTTVAPTTTTLPKLTAFTPDPKKSYTATIKTAEGTIVVALDTKNAPKAAGRFIELANKKFYNGLTFHRAVPDYMIQGGDPKGDGTGTSGYQPVVGETPKNHYPVGVLAAAKTPSDPPGTFDCQFFVVTGSQGSALSNDYASFGNVTSGLDVAQSISKQKTGGPNGDALEPPVKIDSITITES